MSRPMSPAHANDFKYKQKEGPYDALAFQTERDQNQHHIGLLSSPVSLHLAQLKDLNGQALSKNAYSEAEIDHAGRWVPLQQPRAPPSEDVFGGQAMEHSNSLGLFDSFQGPALTHGSMSTSGPGSSFTQHRSHHQHTDSMSSTSSFAESGMHPSRHPAMLQRQDSLSNLSNLSETSSASFQQDGSRVYAASEIEDQSPHSATFSASQSPSALQSSLHSISGLAISTPQGQHDLQPHDERSPHNFAGAGHSELLSLSGYEATPEHHDLLQRHTNFAFPSAPQLMAPPPNKRRATQLAHSLYTSDVRQLRTDVEGGDDKTPMPTNAQAFTGQQPLSEVSNMAAAGAHHQTPAQSSYAARPNPHQPSTPASSSSVATMVGIPGHPYNPDTPSHVPPQYSPFTFMTPQYGGHPQHSPEGTFSGMGSSMSGSAFSAPRLARMDSFESAVTSTGSSSPSSEPPMSYGPGGRTLEMAFADHEAKAGSSAFAGPQHAHLQGGMSNSASVGMSRIASAPIYAYRDGDAVNDTHSGPPSTPQRSQAMAHSHSAMQHGGDGNALPATPSGQMGLFGQHAQLAHLTMSAPPMATSKSMSFLSSPQNLPSPTSSIDGTMGGPYTPYGTPHGQVARGEYFGSPLASSLALQSPSSGVFRTMSGRGRGMSQGASGANVAQQHSLHGGPPNKGRPGVPPPLIVSSADKLHVCHCGKRFKRLEHLKRHSRVHTQERPHQCPAPGCNKWFGRTDNLTQHLRTHYRTLGRSSESLLRITQSGQSTAAASAASMHSPQQSMSMSMPGLGMPAHMPLTPLEGLPLHQMPQHGTSADSALQQPTGARDDPHAAAAAAAARVVSKNSQQQQLKRRITISNDALLGGPITLMSPTSNRSPTAATTPNAPQHESQ